MKNMSEATTQQKTFVFLIEMTLNDDLYPIERMATLAKSMDTGNVYVLVEQANQKALHILADYHVTPIVYSQRQHLVAELRKLQPHMLIRDGVDTEVEEVAELKRFIPTIVHFDDFGNGGQAADCVLHSLYHESREALPSHYLIGPSGFVVTKNIPQSLQQETETKDSSSPHIVVSFEGSDAENLTYRTLRHLMQLHIPLQISVVLSSSYKHSVDDLKMMALGRRKTLIIQKDGAFEEMLLDADIIICNARYSPYKVATLGIPCIVMAQNERELLHAYPREEHGFIHLGLGRKLKQSHLQNAVMEFLLHEARKERAVKKQRQYPFCRNNDYLTSLLSHLAENPPTSRSFLLKEEAKKSPRMLQ